ncbi:hypothetical protein RhiirA4_479126, partial [Rhizophagus irregularis]
EKIIVNNISDFEDFPIELLNPEFEQELSEIEPLREELTNDKDEEVSEIASFTSRFHIKNIIHSNVPVELDGFKSSGAKAESAHALINREGKQLNLMSAILCGKRHDKNY